MLSAISTDNVQYSLAFTFASGLMMAVVVGAFMLGGQLFALIKLQKLDIVEELKSRE
jgi:ABC-type antimicrobial peptide transport system permease subunit